MPFVKANTPAQSVLTRFTMNAMPHSPHKLRMLLIGEGPTLNDRLCHFLGSHGFQPIRAPDGRSGFQLAGTESFALILLEAALPDQTGLQWLQYLRKTDTTPVILLSLPPTAAARSAGLRLGADDCLSQPTDPDELLARMQALLRRSRDRHTPGSIDGAQLQLDDLRQDACYLGHWLLLTSTEYRLLATLLSQPGRVFDKPSLYQQALNRHFGRHDRSLDMHISHLRKKLARAGYPGHRLQTAWGQGYRFHQEENS